MRIVVWWSWRHANDICRVCNTNTEYTGTTRASSRMVLLDGGNFVVVVLRYYRTLPVVTGLRATSLNPTYSCCERYRTDRLLRHTRISEQ